MKEESLCYIARSSLCQRVFYLFKILIFNIFNNINLILIFYRQFNIQYEIKMIEVMTKNNFQISSSNRVNLNFFIYYNGR